MPKVVLSTDDGKPDERGEGEMERVGLENEPPTVDWGPDVGSERFYDFE